MDITTLAFIGILAGAILRTAYGFLTKLSTDETVKFDRKYLATLAASVITTFMLAFVVFGAFQIPTETPLVYVIVSALLAGYAINDVANRGLSTYQVSKEA